MGAHSLEAYCWYGWSMTPEAWGSFDEALSCPGSSMVSVCYSDVTYMIVLAAQDIHNSTICSMACFGWQQNKTQLRIRLRAEWPFRNRLSYRGSSQISYNIRHFGILFLINYTYLVYTQHCTQSYRKTSNISRTIVGNKFVDHSDVVGASPVGAAPTTSAFTT